MRIIAGAFGGRRLHAPRGQATRPTSDRVKEALFSILGAPSRSADRLFRVLDLFAGSGALGLEAVSRGADEAVLVEQDRQAAEAARRNVTALGVGARVRVIEREVGVTLRDLGRHPDEAFDWVFLDPPYAGGALDRALRLLAASHALADGAQVIAEHAAKSPPAERYGTLVRKESRRWGDTAVSFFQREA